MRDILEAVASGELSPAAAEARLAGYASTDAGRFDAAREHRRGVPEAILADGKIPEETASLALTALETTGRALVTRTDEATVAAVSERVGEARPGATVDVDERARTVVAHAPGFERPSLEATVAVVTAGTSDAAAAGEAATVLREMGATVDRIDDVGVANIDRALDQREALRAADALVVAAGREGALPTVVAGMVDAPVVALPVSVGYGFGGEGEAALAGMLQSCSVLSVVNVDAGFVAGAQTGLIARAVSAARDG
ncbi:nickel pincer cofactor biosynthesis protein LarB [Haloprofundus halobius]|uniref:nickel pincer cofactor biosynthesis protein LarB n=1 Tax=Haloprofundus halobius TaxID=2876194 RepID=UPI001CD03F1C|nr:nickel pincer cofactor biosynthesis protein LarB [Haloprofundus halobius]